MSIKTSTLESILDIISLHTQDAICSAVNQIAKEIAPMLAAKLNDVDKRRLADRIMCGYSFMEVADLITELMQKREEQMHDVF